MDYSKGGTDKLMVEEKMKDRGEELTYLFKNAV